MQETLLSGIIGTIIGYLISFLTLRYQYKDLYARSVSSNRMQWINSFRKELSVVIATLKTGKNRYEAEKARAKLLMRINMNTAKDGNEYNGVFADMLNQIDFNNSKCNNALSERLINVSRKILEYEWQRVKEEARGKRK